MDVKYECDAQTWRACRVCLDSDSKLFHLFRNGLHVDFFSITGIQISQDDGLPQYICYICCELLRQATAFRSKSHSTQRILNILPAVHISSTRNVKTAPLKCLSTTVTHVTGLPQFAAVEETNSSINHVDNSAIIVKLEAEETIDEPDNTLNDGLVKIYSDDDIVTFAEKANKKTKNVKATKRKVTSLPHSEEKTDCSIDRIDHVDDSAKFVKSETEETIKESENSSKELVKIYSNDDIETLQRDLKVKRGRSLLLLKKVKTNFFNNSESENLNEQVHQSCEITISNENLEAEKANKKTKNVKATKLKVGTINDQSYKILLIKAKPYTNKNLHSEKQKAIESFRDSANFVHESHSCDTSVIDQEYPNMKSTQIDVKSFDLPQALKINEEGEKFLATKNMDLNEYQYDDERAVSCLVNNYLLSDTEQERKKIKHTRKNNKSSHPLNQCEPYPIKEIESIKNKQMQFAEHIKEIENVTKKAKNVFNPRALPKCKSIFDMNSTSLKQYLINTSTVNVYAQMLYKYVIEKYIDKTREFTKIGDLEDVCSGGPSEFIDNEGNATEIDQQETIEPSKTQLYDFIKDKYTTETKNDARNQEPIKDVLSFNFKKTHGTILKRQTSIAELQKSFNVEYFLTVEEQKQHMKSRAKLKRYVNSEFKCEDCYIGFKFKTTLEDHMKVHDPILSGELACGVCFVRFRHKNKLLRHQISHKYKFVCKRCGKVFRNTRYETRADHMRKSHGSIPCDICYELMMPTGISSHLALAHRETFECQSCRKVFNDAEALCAHARNSMSGFCDPNVICCTVCGQHFESQNMLMAHVQEHRTTRKRSRKSVWTKVQHKEGRTETKKDTEERITNKEHKIPKREFMCEMCGSVFISEVAVRNHQVIHSDDKQFECDICSKRFNFKINLRGHIERHSGLRPFKCALCPLDFNLKSNLRRHQLVHTKERPFACEICGNRFQQLSNVKTHIHTVHMGLRPPPRKRSKVKKNESE